MGGRLAFGKILVLELAHVREADEGPVWKILAGDIFANLPIPEVGERKMLMPRREISGHLTIKFGRCVRFGISTQLRFYCLPSRCYDCGILFRLFAHISTT